MRDSFSSMQANGNAEIASFTQQWHHTVSTMSHVPFFRLRPLYSLAPERTMAR
jgi:hypothetical protein